MILTENQRRLIAAGHATTDESPIRGPVRESGNYQREDGRWQYIDVGGRSQRAATVAYSAEWLAAWDEAVAACGPVYDEDSEGRVWRRALERIGA